MVWLAVVCLGGSQPDRVNFHVDWATVTEGSGRVRMNVQARKGRIRLRVVVAENATRADPVSHTTITLAQRGERLAVDVVMGKPGDDGIVLRGPRNSTPRRWRSMLSSPTLCRCPGYVATRSPSR